MTQSLELPIDVILDQLEKSGNKSNLLQDLGFGADKLNEYRSSVRREAEIRFVTPIGDSINSGVSSEIYQLILNVLTKTHPVVRQTWVESTWTHKTRQYLVRKRAFSNEQQDHWSAKEQIWNLYGTEYVDLMKDYQINIAVSIESDGIIPSSFETNTANWVRQVDRQRIRQSFFLYNGTIRADLTKSFEVRQTHKRSSYDVELEVVNFGIVTWYKDLPLATTWIIKEAIIASRILYPVKIQEQILMYLNKMLLNKEPNRYPIILSRRETLVELRNLKLSDLRWKGLVGNPSTRYSVSNKVDGIRMLLLVALDGIWFINPPNRVNLISVSFKSEAFRKHAGTVLDGELVPRTKQRGKSVTEENGLPFYYIHLDTIAISGSIDIQKRSHTERLRAAGIIIDDLKDIEDGKVLHIESLEHRLIALPDWQYGVSERPEDPFSLIERMLLEQENKRYISDGLVFTPIESKYNPRSDTFPLNDRILEDHPDRCKWKPTTQLTIDLYVDNLSPVSLKVLGEKGAYEEFSGTSRQYFNKNMIRRGHVELIKGQIFEFEIRIGTKGGVEVFPIKERSDKPVPNRREIAEDTWDLFFDPVTQETLTGKSFSLMNEYHKRIQTTLYREAGKHIRGIGTTLLEIGPNVQLRFAEWARAGFQDVIITEPIPERADEIRRLSDGQRSKIHVVQEDISNITAISSVIQTISKAEQVFAISAINTLDYYWKDKETFDSLIRAIKTFLHPLGILILMTIDGDQFDNIFHPLNGLQSEKIVRDPDGSYLMTENLETNQISIHIPNEKDSLYNKVYLSDLFRGLNPSNIDVQPATEERFLGPAESVLTSVYSYGFVNVNSHALSLAKPEDAISETPGIGDQLLLQLRSKGVPSEEISVSVPILSPRTLERSRPRESTRRISRVQEPISREPRGPEPRGPEPMRSVFGTTTIRPRPIDRPQLTRVPIIRSTPIVSLIQQVSVLKLKDEEPEKMTEEKRCPFELIPVPRRYKRQDLPSDRDDSYHSLKCTWCKDKIVSIGTIGDGSCFFHAVFKAGLPRYQENGSFQSRKTIVREFRTALADFIGYREDNIPVVYKYVSEGAFSNGIKEFLNSLRSQFEESVSKFTSNTIEEFRETSEHVASNQSFETLMFIDPPSPSIDAIINYALQEEDPVNVEDDISLFGKYLQELENVPIDEETHSELLQIIIKLPFGYRKMLGFGERELDTRRRGPPVRTPFKLNLRHAWGLPQDYMQRYKNAVDLFSSDPSIGGIQSLLLSNKDVGEEIYMIVATVLNINIYIVRGYTDDIVPYRSIEPRSIDNLPWIVILGNGFHYEVIGVEKENGIQTVFQHDDPFIQSITIEARRKR